ncbi:hypothetical protein IS360_003600 [Salmonella enterica]|nr:hypothetical protein [Salmonella enterica]
MSNDMYFDPSSFDFTSLVDVVETEPTAPKQGMKLNEVTADGGRVDDISDLSDLFESNDEDENQEETDLNNNVSDLLPKENDSDAITLFNDLPDDALVTFGNREITKAQANEYISKIDEYEQQKEVISTSANNIDQIHRFIMQDHHKHKTVLDLQREAMQQELGRGVNDIRRGEIALKMQSLNEAEINLVNRTKEKMFLLDEERNHATKFRLDQADHFMQKEVPQWNQIKGPLLQDLISTYGEGILSNLEPAWNKNVAMMVLNDYRYRNGRKKAGAAAMEAAKAKAPRSTSTAANAQRQQALDTKATEKAALIKKAKTGNLSKADHTKMFDFLVD